MQKHKNRIQTGLNPAQNKTFSGQPLTEQNADKAFTTLAAQLALQGHALTRSNPIDGAVTYHVSRWNVVRALPNLEAVTAFLSTVGGNNV